MTAVVEPDRGLRALEAEQSLLGALLIDSAALPLISDTIRVDHFGTDDHRAIFEAISGLVANGNPVDVVTVAEALNSAGKLDSAGGLPYVGSLKAATPTAANVEHYAKIVRDRADRRSLVSVLTHAAAAARRPGAVVGALADGVVDAVRKIAVTRAGDGTPYQWASALKAEGSTDEFVEGVLARGAMGVIYGESGSGKTYLALDLSCRVALGWPWLGRRTERGPVLYVAAEAGGSIANRLKAFRDHHGVSDLDVAVVTIPVDLRDPNGDTRRIIAAIRNIERERGEPVLLCVVDTLSRAFGSGNENASEDMGALVRNSDLIRHETGANVLWVHHCGKDAAKGARGHSLLRAATDTEIEVTNRDGFVVAKITKQRDGHAGDELAAKLIAVDVGVSKWGTPTTACVVEPLEAAPLGVKRAKSLTANETNALEALRVAIADHGERVPATSAIPSGVVAVGLERWRFKYQLIDRLDLESADPKELGRETSARKTRFLRARNQLRAAGVIGNTGDLWWIN
jgi:hypothetical protein